MSPADTELIEARAAERPLLHWGQLGGAERKLLSKLQRYLGFGGSTQALLLLDRTSVAEAKGFGATCAETLETIQQHVRADLARPLSDDPAAICARLCGPSDGPAWPIERLDAVLALSLDQFFRSLDQRDARVAGGRWALSLEGAGARLFSALQALQDQPLAPHPRECGHEGAGAAAEPTRHKKRGSAASQKQIATELGITEGRVNQIEKQLHLDLRRCASVAPAIVARSLTPHRRFVLERRLPGLRSRFADEVPFLHYLQTSAGLETGELVREQCLEPDTDWAVCLHKIAAVHPAPLPLAECLDALARNHGLSEVHGVRCIERWAQQGRVRNVHGGLEPLRLSRRVGVAHVLCDKPNGMARADVERAVSARAVLSEPPDHGEIDDGFRHSPWVYLASRTLVRHLRFLEVGDDEKTRIFAEARRVLEGETDLRCSLKHVADKARLPERCDRYVLREVMRRFGAEHGVYFDGASRRDTLSLDPNFRRMTGGEKMLRIFEDAGGPLSVREAAARTPSRNEQNAYALIRSLSVEGKLIRISSRLYETRERALAPADRERVEAAIGALVQVDRRPVEADHLREELNEKLCVSFSKWVYAAVAAEVAQRQGWFAGDEIYGLERPDFGSPQDAFQSVDERGLDLATVRHRLGNVLRVSDTTLRKSVPRWRSLAHRRRRKPQADA